MNKYILIALCALCLVASACKKDKQKKEVSNLYMTADRNNLSWVTNWHTFAEIGGSKNYQLIGNMGEEHLNVGVTQNSLNQYILVNEETEFDVTVGLDVVVARYVLDGSATNTVNITNHDSKKVIMEGNFNLTFKKVTGTNDYPAIVNFTNGKFRVSMAYD